MGNSTKKPEPALRFGPGGLVRNHNLRGMRIENVNLARGVIDDIDFSSGKITGSNLRGLVVANCEIDVHTTINGIRIKPLLEAAAQREAAKEE